MIKRQLVAVPRWFAPNVERQTLERLIRALADERDAMARELAELAALDDQLAILRCCRDATCHHCPSCVTALFVKAQPTPLTLPLKYEAPGPWRRESVTEGLLNRCG